MCANVWRYCRYSNWWFSPTSNRDKQGILNVANDFVSRPWSPNPGCFGQTRGTTQFMSLKFENLEKKTDTCSALGTSDDNIVYSVDIFKEKQQWINFVTWHRDAWGFSLALPLISKLDLQTRRFPIQCESVWMSRGPGWRVDGRGPDCWHWGRTRTGGWDAPRGYSSMLRDFWLAFWRFSKKEQLYRWQLTIWDHFFPEQYQSNQV